MVRARRLPQGSPVSDIFDEVSEDLRAEKASKLLQRYGGAIVAAAVAIVLAVSGYKLWGYYENREAVRVATTYLAAMQASTTDKPAALAGFTSVSDESTAGYRTLARLRAAALKADAGDRPGAAALWQLVSNDAAADVLLRDLATLEYAMHELDNGDPAAVAARLAPLTNANNPWHFLAEEAQALLDLRQGKNDTARATLKRLAQDVTAPDGVRGRANGLLARLGG